MVGGQNETGAERLIFDPANKTFSVATRLLHARSEPTAALLSDGRVLMIGGRAGDESIESIEIYDPAPVFVFRRPLPERRTGWTKGDRT